MRIYRILVLMVAVLAFAACGGIQWSTLNPSDGGDDVTDDDETAPLAAPVVTHDEGTRATVIIEQIPEDVEVEISIDGGDFEDVTGDLECDDDDCTYDVPVDPNESYNVAVRYTMDDNVSPVSSVSIDTTLKGAMYMGYEMASGHGSGLAVGDVNGDGHADILVGPRANAAAANRRVDLFLGGPDLIDANGNMQPWANFTDLDSLTHGSVVHIADVTCDGKPDILIAEHDNAVNEGLVYIIDSNTIVAGNQITDGMFTYKIRDDEMNTSFGFAFAPIDADGSGCYSLAIGAPMAPNDGGFAAAGELYVVSPSDFVFELDVPDSMRVFEGVNTGDMAGLYVANAGDVDASGLENALFNRESDGAAAPTWDIYLAFSNSTYFGMLTSITGLGCGPLIAMGKLGGDDFYVRGGMGPAMGAFVNLYDDGSSFIPDNQVISDTRDSFGSGVALANLYQRSSTLDLLVGSDTDILVYFDYGLGAGFDVMPDVILNNVEGLTTMTGKNMIVADVTGDGYDDIIVADPLYDDGATNDVGAIYVYY